MTLQNVIQIFFLNLVKRIKINSHLQKNQTVMVKKCVMELKLD